MHASLKKISGRIFTIIMSYQNYLTLMMSSKIQKKALKTLIE